MREACAAVVTNFKSFIGSGWLMWIVYCLALVICFFFWKEKRKKLVTVSMLGCVVIINPIVYSIVGKRFMSGVYWRLFWALPIVIVVAATLTFLVGKCRRSWLRITTAFVMCIVIAFFGKSVINHGTYCMPENDYQIPQYVINVSDIILEDSDGAVSMAVVPNEMLCYVRQYTSKITLAYGRNIWGYINTPVDWQVELYNLMNAEELDYELLHDKVHEAGCRYIVFNSEHRKLPENMEEYGYSYIDMAEPFVVFEVIE